jgi:hypothetical protein
MKAVHRGILLAVLQCLLVLAVAGKYAWDRERLPRVWVRTVSIDPNLPVRGRYVSLRLEVNMQADPAAPVSLSIENGILTARHSATNRGSRVIAVRNSWALVEPVAYFIPEHAPDPTRLRSGEELWVEVSVPPAGPPRPIRIGVKRDGALHVLPL